MAIPARTTFSLLVVATLLLAGCTSDSGSPSGGNAGENAPPIEATATTGGIRGVVVDDRITPIKGATVSITPGDKTLETGEDGLFAVSGLEPGEYFIRASHPLYSDAQQSTSVVAGEANPKAVKIQLVRSVFENPYYQTLTYDGFIVCSINIIVLLSEECGEGVGTPCEVPAVGCQRVGGQDGNNVQFDFTIGAGAKTLVVEKYWEPTSEAGTALYSPISTAWSCLPVCSGNRVSEIEGESPLYTTIDNATLEAEEILPDETVISIFTWASPETTGAVLNQKYTDYVTVFYHVPAPEGWSFVNGSPNPF